MQDIFIAKPLDDATYSANSTFPGAPDFGAVSLGSDILEKVYRPKTGTTKFEITVTFPRTVVNFVAILAHNITGPISVILNNRTYTVQSTPDNTYIQGLFSESATSLKIRFDESQKPGNKNDIFIGRIFAARHLNISPKITSKFDVSINEYKEDIKTEGFYKVSVLKAVRKSIKVEFKDVEVKSPSFQTLWTIFKSYGTSYNLAWIFDKDFPVPNYLSIYGKLRDTPKLKHISLSPDSRNTVSFSLEISE